MQKPSQAMDNLRRLGNRLDHTCFIVSKLKGDEGWLSVLAQGRFERRKVQQAILQNWQSVFLWCPGQHTIMLTGTGPDRPAGPVKRQSIGLGPTAGEDHALRRGACKHGNRLACLF